MAQNYETFIKLYKSASPEIRAFIDSDEIGKFADQLIAKQELTTEHKKPLISILADLILDTELNSEKVVSELGLDSAKSADLVKEVDQFISQHTSHPNALPKTEPEIKTEEIDTLEKSIESLPKMRTMSADMRSEEDKETTTSTSQEDLLKGKQS